MFPDGSCTSPPPGKHIRASSLPLCTWAQSSGRNQTLLLIHRGAVHLAGAAEEFEDYLGPNSQVSEGLNPQTSLPVIPLLIPHAGLGVLIHIKGF